MNTPTLYASPYVVCTNKGYTKHYYAEDERICSKIGGGGLRDIGTMPDFAGGGGIQVSPDELFKEKQIGSQNLLTRFTECSGSKNEIKTDVLKDPLYANQDSLMPEKALYFYHPDHLGSSSWITYTDGKAMSTSTTYLTARRRLTSAPQVTPPATPSPPKKKTRKPATLTLVLATTTRICRCG